MPNVRHAIMLHAPPAQTWARITTLSDLPRWLVGVVAVQSISQIPTQPGTTFEIIRTGQRDPEHWIVLDWEPQRSVRLTEYHDDLHLCLQLEPAAGGTRLSARLQWREARGLLQRFNAPTSQRLLLEHSMDQLKLWIDGK